MIEDANTADPPPKGVCHDGHTAERLQTNRAGGTLIVVSPRETDWEA
jgi:hypothetical protein